jgi:DnaJ-class molecular chaperone
MLMKYEEIVRPELGGWAKECRNCHGAGYIEVGSTIEPDENDLLECEECNGQGVVDTFRDPTDDYRESVTEF